MIQVHIDDKDELIISGEMQEGDIIPGLCCPGYNFVVDSVIFSCIGHCENPIHNSGDDPYDGVEIFDTEEIALFLIGEAVSMHSEITEVYMPVPCPSCTFRGPVWLSKDGTCVYCEETWQPDENGWDWIWEVVPWEWWLEYGMIHINALPEGCQDARIYDQIPERKEQVT